MSSKLKFSRDGFDPSDCNLGESERVSCTTIIAVLDCLWSSSFRLTKVNSGDIGIASQTDDHQSKQSMGRTGRFVDDTQSLGPSHWIPVGISRAAPNGGRYYWTNSFGKGHH